VAYGGGYFVAVGEGGAIAACPASAVSMKNAAGWKARSDSDNRFTGVTINSVVYSDSTKKFYIAANGGNMGWAAAADFGASSGALDWHHYGYSSGTKLSGANVQKIAFGRRGASYALGVTYNDGRGIALIDESAFCVSDGWDADLETFGFMGHPVYAGICFGAPEAGGDGYWLAAGEAAYIGWWPSAAPSDTSSRWWTALSFKEFHSWGIHCVAAMNGLFFVGGDGGKIAYSGGLRP
jgi:hypothetical protein